MRRYFSFLIIIFFTFYIAVLYQSAAFLVLGYGEIFGGILVFGYLFCMAGKISVSLQAASDVGEMGEALPVNLILSNRGRLPAGQVRITLQEEYPLWREKKRTVFCSTVPAAGDRPGESRVRLEFYPRHSGRVRLRVLRADVYDFLGILPLFIPRKRRTGEAVVCTFPKRYPASVVVRPAVRDFAWERETQGIRGERQPNEIWQIRDYQPGDRLRDIHWKLTAKTGDMMVNERRGEKDCPVYFFLEGGASKKGGKRSWRRRAQEQEGYFEVALSLSFAMAERGCAHCLVWFDPEEQGIRRFEVHGEEDVFLFFQQLEHFGAMPSGESLEDGYWQKYRGSWGNTSLLLDSGFQCLCNGELVADYRGKDRERLLREQELYV